MKSTLLLMANIVTFFERALDLSFTDGRCLFSLPLTEKKTLTTAENNDVKNKVICTNLSEQNKMKTKYTTLLFILHVILIIICMYWDVVRNGL